MSDEQQRSWLRQLGSGAWWAAVSGVAVAGIFVRFTSRHTQDVAVEVVNYVLVALVVVGIVGGFFLLKPRRRK